MTPDRAMGAAPLFGWRGVALALPLAVLMCWPAWTTGAVFSFPDTQGYLRAGEVIWSTLADLVAGLALGGEGGGGAGPALETDARGGSTVGRSVTYGFAAYVLDSSLGPLAVAVGQTWFVLVAATALVTRAALRSPAVLGLGVAVLGLATPLPFYAAYLMPDLLASVPILFAAALVWRFDDLTLGQRVVLTSMTALAASAHYGAMPLTLAAGVVGLALRVLAGRGVTLAPVVAVAATAAFAPLLNVGASSVALERTSVAPLRLPILLARSIDDGPARWYLEEACPEAELVLCDVFADGVPKHAGQVLWAPGGVADATRAQMASIRREERAVLIGAFLDYPAQQLWSLFGNAARQTVLVGTGDLRPVTDVRPGAAPVRVEPDAPAHRLLRTMDGVLPWSVLAATAVLGALAVAARPDRRAALAVLAVLCGLALNAGIFGGLSAPVDRYQSRVIWVLPFVLLLVWRHCRRDAADRERRGAPSIRGRRAWGRAAP